MNLGVLKIKNTENTSQSMKKIMYFDPCIEIIKKIVYKRLILPGYFKQHDFLNVVNNVVCEDLKVREQQIMGRFSGETDICKYLSPVVWNYCSKLIRDIQGPKPSGPPIVEPPINGNFIGKINVEGNDLEYKDFIKFYKKKFEIVINTFPRRKLKLLFCLKALFRNQLDINELPTAKSNNAERQTIQEIIEKLNNITQLYTDQQIYIYLTIIFNIIERKENGQDAIRKFVEDYIGKICLTLNGSPPQANFGKNNLHELFE